jgi:hypothetical protein
MVVATTVRIGAGAGLADDRIEPAAELGEQGDPDPHEHGRGEPGGRRGRGRRRRPRLDEGPSRPR